MSGVVYRHAAANVMRLDCQDTTRPTSPPAHRNCPVPSIIGPTFGAVPLIPTAIPALALCPTFSRIAYYVARIGIPPPRPETLPTNPIATAATDRSPGISPPRSQPKDPPPLRHCLPAALSLSAALHATRRFLCPPPLSSHWKSLPPWRHAFPPMELPGGRHGILRKLLPDKYPAGSNRPPRISQEDDKLLSYLRNVTLQPN